MDILSGLGRSPVAQLVTAEDEFARLVGQVRDDQWPVPTPCTEWTVRELVNHTVHGNRRFAAILRGEEYAGPEDDVLGDTPEAACRSAAGELLDAFRATGVLERTFTFPVGPAPGKVAVHLRLTEALVHGWDLARATGGQARFAEDVAEQELAFSREMLGAVPTGRTPFRPPRPVAEDAPALDRLAALLGR